MLYLDPSLVITLVTREKHNEQAQDWLEGQDPDQLAVSDWVLTEVASALSIKQRTGHLDDIARARATRAVDELSRAAFTVLPVPRTQGIGKVAILGVSWGDTPVRV